MWTRAKLAEVFKLQGESGYGKLIDALERQKRVIYANDKKVVDRELRIAYFSDLDELWQAGSRVSRNYIAISCDQLGDIVRQELREELDAGVVYTRM